MASYIVTINMPEDYDTPQQQRIAEMDWIYNNCTRIGVQSPTITIVPTVAPGQEEKERKLVDSKD
jgi:hypothetical protein